MHVSSRRRSRHSDNACRYFTKRMSSSSHKQIHHISLSLYHNLSVVTSQPAQAQPKTDAVIFSVVLDREGSNLGIRLEGTYNQFTVYVLLEMTCTQFLDSCAMYNILGKTMLVN